MKVAISHITRYEFDQAVFLEPHLLRLEPYTNRRQTLLDFHLQVEPQPAGAHDLVDVEGNLARQVWFEGQTQFLEINLECAVEVMEYNPLGFLFYPVEYGVLGFTYPAQYSSNLAPYLVQLPIDQDMIEYLERVKKDSGSELVQFLTQLNGRIYQDFQQEHREVGDPFEPTVTFNRKKGSCRDSVWMLMSMVRHLGLAARFVSGYLNPNQEHLPELHAWIEVYLVGGGWIGFDPTSGLVADHNYVWVAASSDPGNTLPVSGNYRGSATSRLLTDLSIKQL